MKIYLFVISIIISPLLAINYVYPESISNNIVTNSIINKTLSYRMEPFLLINGTDYKDIPHNNTLTLQNFTIASWIKTNQSILSEPAHVINKGGFKAGLKLNLVKILKLLLRNHIMMANGISFCYRITERY
jgi:hypothetical protein